MGFMGFMGQNHGKSHETMVKAMVKTMIFEI